MAIRETRAKRDHRVRLERAKIARKMITCLYNLEGAKFNDKMTSPPQYMRLFKLRSEYEDVE